MRTILFFVLCLGLAGTFRGQKPGSASLSGADALQLLDRVAHRYEEAESVHLEATEIGISHSDLYDSKQTSTLFAYVASGGRFRYGGSTWTGSGLIVSDGETEWRLYRSLGQYAKEAPGSFLNGRYALQGDVTPISYAHDLIGNLIALSSYVRAAHAAGEETVSVGNRKVRCVVLRFGLADSTRKGSDPYETRVWIDPKSLIVLKTETRSENQSYFGNVKAPFGTRMTHVNTTLYTVTEIGLAPDADTFRLAPPAQAKEVAQLPDPFPNSARPASGEDPGKKIADAQLGRKLPPMALVDGKGAQVSTARYAGHPLLIDLWATWCGPCMVQLPELAKIRKATAGTDLQIIGIDEDSTPGAAQQLLERRGYGWEDFHYTHAITLALPSNGIPLTVLADASGKIVYYHTGADDPAGLKAAIAKLGAGYEGVTESR